VPSTWAVYGSDGDGDGDGNTDNVFDAASSAGRYLDNGGLDLREPDQRLRAVLRYNNSNLMIDHSSSRGYDLM
jgi:membrane-bound lytic murein transglycosylase B